MKLLDVIIAASGRIEYAGAPFLWKCYGSDILYIEFKDTDGNYYAQCVYNSKTYQTYEIQIHVPLTSNEAGAPRQYFRWIDSDYKRAYYEECLSKNVDPDMIDKTNNYTHVETEELILEYLKDVGETYYDNLPVVSII